MTHGGIATIDIAPLITGQGDRDAVVEQILNSCLGIGFLSVTGTGVSPDLIAAMRGVVQQIFAVDEQAKWDQAITRDNYRGYIPMGFFTPNDGSGTADRYEGYKLHRETAPDDPIRQDCALYGPNRWPEGIAARETVLAYWAELDRVTDALLGALEQGLGLADNTLRQHFVAPLTNMTLLHYPPQAPDDGGYGIHPHKDSSALTIIAPDPVGGLEVKSGGGWITPDCPKGGFVVNIGDVLEHFSGGRLVSTPHRVVNKTGRERYSFPYFAVPRHDAVIRPLIEPVAGFDRPDVHCRYWQAEVWRTNWPDEFATEDTPELGTLHD